MLYVGRTRDHWARRQFVRCERCSFFDDINLDRAPATGLNDAIAVLKIIERIYKASGYDYHA